jgi:hypothetical protein
MLHSSPISSTMRNNNLCQAQIVNRNGNINEDAVTVQLQILSIVLILFEWTFRNPSGNIIHGHWCRVSCTWLDKLTPADSSCVAWFTYASCVWCPETGDRDWFCRFGQSRFILPEDGDRVQSPKCFKQKLRKWIIYRVLIIVLEYAI